SPLLLLMSIAGVTGTSMLIIVLCMGLTSTRYVRRRVYNAFWYTHQLYLPFMVLLMIHPLSGILKQEVFDENVDVISGISTANISSQYKPTFAPIKSMTWLWMALPLSCFFLDLMWRVFSRNLARVRILN
ncbi:jg13176, partial [Pararge aegeria aegeria]